MWAGSSLFDSFTGTSGIALITAAMAAIKLRLIISRLITLYSSFFDALSKQGLLRLKVLLK